MQTHEHALGAMFMVGIRGAEPGHPDLEVDLDHCARAHIGGVVLFSERVPAGDDRNITSPDQLARLIAHTRARLGPRTLVAIDQEGGAVARLTPTHGFAPTHSARAFGKLDRSGRRAAADGMAAELATAGIDWNFAPCVDVDHDPPSPVIGALDRAYACDAASVTMCASEFIDAHTARHIATSIKHFPGHGASAKTRTTHCPTSPTATAGKPTSRPSANSSRHIATTPCSPS